MKFILYRDRKKEWRWRLKARNGRVIATSGEGYKRRRDADYAIHLVRSKTFFADTTTAMKCA